MKTTQFNILSALLLIVTLAFGESAFATTKTVTYTITTVEVGSYSTQITFTRSGDTPFGGGNTTYTASVNNSSLGQTNGGSGSFSVELADGFGLNFSWLAGSNVSFTNNCIHPSSGHNINYGILCNSNCYYVTHLTLTGDGGTWTNTDIAINQQWHFNQQITTGHSLGSVTVTYTDVPLLSIFESAGENTYNIKSKDDLCHLANYVNNGNNNCNGLTFLQTQNITYSPTTGWNNASSNEDNFTSIGNENYRFGGTYDGQGNTISGIRIYKVATNVGNNQGLFGYVDGGTVKNVNLSNARITGLNTVGGIVGYNAGTVERCISSDILTVAGTSNSSNFGSIVGSNIGTISDCLAIGAIVPAVSNNHPIVGNGTALRSYYRSCTVAGETNQSNIYSVTLGDNVALMARTPSATLPGTGYATFTNGASIDGTEYFTYNSNVTLIYTGDPTSTQGYTVVFSKDGTPLGGNSFKMSQSDATITVAITDVWGIEDSADGSKEHPYIITTTVGLDLLATEVNAGHSFFFKDFILGTDIDYSTIPLDANGENYTAIGGYERRFGGTFDGCGYTISGIHIYKGGTDDADSYQGLFGYVEGTVKNVTLTDADITGYSEVGGIVGFMDYGGAVQNCHVTGSVALHAIQDGADKFGGIVGECQLNKDPCTIINCSSSATLTVADGLTNCRRFGGIVGYLIGDLQNCLVLDATLPTLQQINYDYSGAIAGGVNGYANLYHNYYHGVTLYSTTTDIGTGYANTDVHHDITAHDGAVAVYTLTLDEHISASPKAMAIYHNIDYYKAGATVTLSAEGYTLSNEGFIVKDAQDNVVPLTNGNTFVMPESDVTVTADLTVIDWEGNGSEGNPYMIMYCSQLDLLAERVNSGNDYFGKFFKLGADIHYPHTTAWNDTTSTENNYTAIGTNNGVDYCFRGTFDGDGYTVSGIRIYKGGDNSQGLFGKALGGTVRNLTLTDARITGKQNVGGIAGYLTENDDIGGIIENCHITSSVAIHAVTDNAQKHGGIVGWDNGGNVIGCSSAATLTMAYGITGCLYYGGIVGDLNDTLQNCLAIGVNVSGSEDVGAIIGNVHITENSVSHNYYNNCTVSGTANASNVGCGKYYDGQYHYGDITANDGAMPCYKLTLPTALTTSGSAILNYQGNRYVTIGQTVNLVPAYSGYTIESVTVTEDGTNQTVDVSNNSFTMPTADVTVTVIWDDLPNWSGSGEKNDPYLITNCAELDALAIKVNSGNDYEDKYFMLANDINYPHVTAWNDAASTENNYTAIGGYDRKFRGTFDGDGHTISGIRIYKGGIDDADSYQGLFGYTNDCYVYNVTLTDTRITGYNYVGGIIGEDVRGSDAANCHVTATVAIHAVADNCKSHGGIAGSSDGYCRYCTSAATLSVADGVTGCKKFGGIVGDSGTDILNCLVQGVTISGAAEMSGAIVGLEGCDHIQANYYHNCSYGSSMANIGSSEGDISGNDGAMLAEEMSITIPGYGEGNGRWTFIASPMYNTMTPYQVQNLMTTTATHYDLYLFNQDAAGAEWQNYKAHAYFDSHDFDFLLNNGQGYLYASKEDVTLTFLGRINGYKDSTPIYLSYTEGKPLAGYNLVGNPYPVAAYVDRPYYKMNATGDDVEVVEEYWANSIPACSGVVVVATGKNQKVWFSATAPEAPVTSTGDNGSIQMTLTKANERGDAFQDKAIVSFNEGMQLGKFIFNEEHAKLYIPKDGKDYAIVSVGRDAMHCVSTEIPVNFKASENGTYTLTVSSPFTSHLSSFTYLHLIDNLTGADIDLLPSLRAKRSNPQVAYTFTAKTTDYPSRFKLVFNENDNDNENDDGPFAYIYNGEIIVETPWYDVSTIQVIDMLGRILLTRTVTPNSSLPTPNSSLPTPNSPGVYLLRLLQNNHVKTQKIIIP